MFSEDVYCFKLDNCSPSIFQVHHLVRENLLELDDIKRDHEDIFRELQECYGLEKCLKGLDLDLATSE
jgi:hypothetical protein